MAESKSVVTVEAPAWKPGQYWSPGMPIPDGAQLTPHEGGLMTLEARAPEGTDLDIHAKVLRAIDGAFKRSQEPPSQDLPHGLRPYVLLVNPGFAHYFPNQDSWGELNPPCKIRHVAGSDKHFLAPGAVVIGHPGRQVKAYFVTDRPKPGESVDQSEW